MKELYVVDIMNKQQIIINYGIDDGAKIRQKVRVLERGVSIVGKGNAVLGTLDSIKDELEITNIFPKFSICQKIVYDKPLASALSELIIAPSSKQSVDINVNEEQISNKTLPIPTPIKRFDPVEIIK